MEGIIDNFQARKLLFTLETFRGQRRREICGGVRPRATLEHALILTFAKFCARLNIWDPQIGPGSAKLIPTGLLPELRFAMRVETNV